MGRWVWVAAVLLVLPADQATAQPPQYERAERTLGDLLELDDGPGHWVPGAQRTQVDEARATAEGIRKVEGRRLVLFTDLPLDAEIDELPQVFEQAFAGWCEYFGIDPAVHPNWFMTGFLMQDGQRFRNAGLIPPHLPPFPHGYAVNYDLWLYEQETPYYRRHLLIHEGTHGFMNTILKSCGPPWYMEGTAELFGTHRWQEGKLTMGLMPPSREAVPGWGRIRAIQDLYADGNGLPLDAVIDFSGSAHRDNEAYAWSWAAAALLESHPRYQERFRSLSRSVEARDFNQRFRKLVGGQWKQLAEEWQVFIANLEYGYDVPRMAIDFAPGAALKEGWNVLKVDSAGGWQNSHLRLEAGKTYKLHARGRYQVADQPQIWWCEPGGVTMRYYRGRPLGVLLAAVRPDENTDETSPLLRPVAVGLAAELTPEQTGTLFFRSRPGCRIGRQRRQIERADRAAVTG